MPTQEAVVPFGPAVTAGHADQLDRAGKTILQLLNKAASIAEENSRNAQKHAALDAWAVNHQRPDLRARTS